jgi:carboxylesterase
MKGGEPFYYPGGELGCLLIHGFTASPQEMRGLGSSLAGRGHTVLGVRLFAHAALLEDMPRGRWRDWVASAEDGYAMLESQCRSIAILGLSMGGAISLTLAARFPCVGVVAMSTPHQLPPEPLLIRLRPVLRPLSSVYRYRAKGVSRWRDEQAARERVQYTSHPIRALIELDGLLSEMRISLPDVHVPALLIHSRTDASVPGEHMELTFDQLGSQDKEKVWIEESDHIITADHAREEVFQLAGSFLDRISKKDS